MSKTVEIRIEENTVKIDVTRFVEYVNRDLQANKCAPIPVGAAYVAAGLITVQWDGMAVTPRGEDLLASAHLIPDDPAPEQPSAPPCEACNGTGEQTLLVSTHVCDVCQGSKVAPRRGHASLSVPFHSTPARQSLNVPRFFEFTDDEKAALRRYAKTTPFDDGQVRYSMALSVESDGTRVKTEHLPDGRVLHLRDNGAGWMVESVTPTANPWVLIDSEAVARSFVGKRVEIDVPSRGHMDKHALHNATSTVLSADKTYVMLDARKGCIDWLSRGNVRLRVVGGSDV